MERRSPGSSHQVLSKLQSRLPSTDFGWIKRELVLVDRAPAKAKAGRIADLLAVARTRHAAIESVPVNSPQSLAKARFTLNSILSSAQYKRSWLDDLKLRAAKVLQNLLSKIDISGNTINLIGWALLAIVVVAFAILLVMLTLRLIARYSNREAAPSTATRIVTTRKTRQSLESLMAQAEQAAAEGRYRDAFRHVYLASLLLLDRARLITYSESGTNWEYLRALRSYGAPEKTEAFQGMTLLFDQLIYGKRQVSEEDYQSCLRSFRKLEAAA